MLSTSLKIIRNNIKNPSIRYFSTGGHSLRYFMVEYTYEQDAYYKKIPHMEDHQKAVERLQSSAECKVVGAPFFPYTGSVFFIQSETTGDALESVTNFIKSDPYVTNGLVNDYEIKEVAMTHKIKDFERISSDYLIRA